MRVEIENIRGLSFGAAMISTEEYEEGLEDGVLEDVPFEFTDSVVTGPLLATAISQDITIIGKGGRISCRVSGIPSFTSNKEIDASVMFNEEQAAFVKKELKWSVNNYYSAWRKGQSRSEDKLLEVEESGDGSMYAELHVEGDFIKDNLFLVFADPLPFKETVIAKIGYINPDGSIFEGNWEYDDYSYWDPTVKCDGEDVYF